MAEARNIPHDATISSGELARILFQPGIKIVDASFFPPNLSRSASAEYESLHIPGAVFFDIDGIADSDSSLPHMLPSPADFARKVGELGIGSGDTVVVYDSQGIFSAPRVWWMFRIMGHDKVLVLDGGLPKWLAERQPVTNKPTIIKPAAFSATLRPELVRSADDVASGQSLLIDARSPGRFSGEDLEIWPGRRAGHIPGSCNVFFGSLIDSGRKTLLPPDALREKFAGVDLSRPLTVSCGSGVTACILALALYQLGYPDVAVYDGSWAEWGLPASNRPVEVGALSSGDSAL